MQKGLILYMGYYGRYTAAYSIGCLLMLSLYIAGIFLHWAAFGELRRRGVSGRDTRVPTLAEPQHAAQPGIE